MEDRNVKPGPTISGRHHELRGDNVDLTDKVVYTNI